MLPTIRQLQEKKAAPDICGLHGSSTALFLSRAATTLGRTICCILASDEQLETLTQDIALFSSSKVLVYPSFEIPPYTPLSPDPSTVSSRLSTLYQLQTDSSPCIVLTSAEAILRRILPQERFHNHCELVMAGEETNRDSLIASLVDAGYEHCAMVRQPGDMALRGGIIDIFPPAAEASVSGPLRLDFFGDLVESIRLFDPLTQRSKKDLEEAVLLPASDLLFPATEDSGRFDIIHEAGERHNWPSEQTRTLYQQFRTRQRFPGIEFMLPLLYGGPDKLATFFDYLPPDSGIIINDPLAVGQRVNLVEDRILANYEEAVNNAVAAIPPSELFLTKEGAMDACKERAIARFAQLPDPDSSNPVATIQSGDHTLLSQEIGLQRKKRGILAPLADRMIKWRQNKETTVVACRSPRQARHFSEMLSNYQLSTAQVQAPFDPETLRSTDDILLIEHPLSRGFDLIGEKLHVLSTLELFGERRLRVSKRKKTRGRTGLPVQIDQLAEGDVIVHRDHGVGIFQELINMEFSGQCSDFMQIAFRDDDKLYVPVDRLHLISRYQGLNDQQPKIDSLGSQRWQATKKKVTDAVWEVAQELLAIYARRALEKGHRFSPPGALYRELEESFPFDETKDQAKAIDDVLDDLTSEQPMDRLICGDVGYGKTEVAARAAFKAIEDGFQVAVLVPTTVLAEQHAATFRERFAAFPVNVASLNRFRTSKQQKAITTEITNGQADLVIGTHRLLSKDIAFKKLGLLIIDEEHRFGVSHKEKIKKLKADVAVLTLTATPIPRTLQMSLLAIRDLSVISTPPRQRRSVKTFLARHDQLVIREAVLRELQRGGQLFFVHNRVRSIHRVAETIESLVPQARIGIAHGQMPGPQLEEVMVRFINHEIDILICTTIVESGLDIPNANTIIINRADHLGLADIYQLRGRVGRSSRQAYAYLLVPSLDALTKDAKQRLRALMDNSELGSGFKLAMNDLQIRGGGNLLGISQSGHIAAVGYDLYLELLQATVADLKKKAAAHDGDGTAVEVEPEVKLKVSAYIPDTYITDTTQRYHAYRQISEIGSLEQEQLDDIHEELADRYGPLPAEATMLLQLIGLKQQLRPLGIHKLEQGPESLIFSIAENAPIAPQLLVALIQEHRPSKKRQKAGARLTPDHRLIVPLEEEESLFKTIQSVLQFLQR